MSTPQTPSKTSSSAEDGQKADTSARVTSRQGDQRSATNTNKRKLDAPNGPVSSSAPSGSSRSRSSAGPTIPKEQPASLPPRPSPATVAASGNGGPKVPRADRQSQALHHLKGSNTPVSPPVPNIATSKSVEPSSDAPPSARTDGVVSRLAKKVRSGANDGDRGRINSRSDLIPIARSLNVLGAAATKGKASLPRAEDPTAAPSLLSRLTGQPSGAPVAASPTPDRDQPQTEKDRRQGRRSKLERNGEQEKERPKSLTTSVVPAKRPADPSTLGIVTASTAPSVLTSISRRGLSLPDSDKDPIVGFSIRGAAKAAHAASTKDGNQGAGSLLERLQASEGIGSEWGGRRKKRTKHC
ncbi:hypothetical protein LXA43DRAFT_167822 [Ganoderma leucocontextum]|nr:hypothetical protein LXA43DRAFT_167822 [Ganoderma leucocontextum]